jgi:hypothetical protein
MDSEIEYIIFKLATSVISEDKLTLTQLKSIKQTFINMMDDGIIVVKFQPLNVESIIKVKENILKLVEKDLIK